MAAFVFIVKLLVAAFVIAVAVELVALVIGSIGLALEYWERRHGNETD